MFLSSFLSPLTAYEVIFKGEVAEEVLDLATSISRLEAEHHRPPPTLVVLKKRVEADRVNLIQLLHTFGYYEGDVAVDYSGTFPETTVHITLLPGPRYYFEDPAIINAEGTVIPLPDADLSLQPCHPACAQAILDTEEQLLQKLGGMGYPLCTLANRHVVVDQENKRVQVTYSLETGPLARFGAVEIEGLCKVRREFITRRLLWAYGDPYHLNKVICTDAYLQQSGLFSAVTVAPGDRVDEEGYLPMRIRVEEKHYRHMGVGVSYSTDESVGVMAQWSHDNFSGWGDALTFNGEYSEVVKRATLLYGMPDLFGKKQDLLYSTEVRREDAPGFIEQELSMLVRLSKKVTDKLSFNYGMRYECLFSTKSDNNANYNLFSLPIQIRWDTSNRLLNPTRGTTVAYFLTPYQAVVNENVFFLKQELLAVTYHPLTSSGWLLLSLSGQLGSICGQARFEIPPPKRFYAGSSTTLRGYKYLSVSPLEGNKPVGGRSLIVGSIEPRIRIYDKLYSAFFYDVGNVYATSLPFARQKKVLQSVGAGVVYLTPVGSFRLDIGFPLNRRKGIDKTFQIYASLGQTF